MIYVKKNSRKRITILLWLFFIPNLFADCHSINLKKYNKIIASSITSYILVNFSEISSDLNQRDGDYLDSLLTQLNLPNNDKTLNYLIELVNSSKNSYDFAMALTKDKN